MNDSTKYDKKERRVTFPPEFASDMLKSEQRGEFNKVFNQLMNPLTGRAYEIARLFLYDCMKSYIPVEALPDLKAAYFRAIKFIIKEGRV